MNNYNYNKKKILNREIYKGNIFTTDDHEKKINHTHDQYQPYQYHTQHTTQHKTDFHLPRISSNFCSGEYFSKINTRYP